MLKVSEIMTRDVVTMTPETTLREAIELLAGKHIGGAPVVSGHIVLGVVSASDILEFAASAPELADAPADALWGEQGSEEELEHAIAIPGSYYTDLFAGQDAEVTDRIDGAGEPSMLDAHTVDEVMTRDPIALSPHASVLAAADVMRSRSVHRVLVVDDGKLIGILTTLDLARAVAQQKLTTRTYVFGRDRDLGPSRFPR